ncbi:MAG: 5-amino-6-(D-ribitylamino)uracil--L-tyrosine 4-hydroxyphenyl transferase CofH [Actinobacteria bacterium]|nr:5-amino-6-(D-ribitylamino)uracil--L-tyrosine 4-hydroxyphenyl transferase CofH [Actinomycetota bacterium]
MRPVTFCRLSDPDAVTTELSRASAEDIRVATDAGLLSVSVGLGEGDPAAWVLTADETALVRGVAGWRITVLHEGRRTAVLDALVRSGARFLRSDRPMEAVTLTSLPGVEADVSVSASDVDEALACVQGGATDLLLDGWDDRHIGRLRDALEVPLIERTALPLGIVLDDVRSAFTGPTWTTYLRLVDGMGAVRPRDGWAPGKDMPIPAPPGRISAEWGDSAWVTAVVSDPIGGATPEVQHILSRSLAGSPPTRDEIETLFRARGKAVEAIAWTADHLRAEAVGKTVTYIVNRNINYTNVCTYKCRFCAFSKGPRSLDLRGTPYLMSVEDVVRMASEASDQGATEVCLQGGIHPGFTGDFYLELIGEIKAVLPGMHIHGFTPLEVWQGAETLGISVRDYLKRLRDAGLGSLPGTAAEILDDRVRVHLCPDKITTAEWADVMMTAHELGLRSTATVMFGHIDDPAAWADHLEVLRIIQRRTGGFTEFVPLPFVHMGAPIHLQGNSRMGPTWDEVVLMHAVARIAFDGLIPNIQASWVKLGLDGARRLLAAGCNDLGGTLMGEAITRSAGASHGQEMTVAQFEDLIRSADRVPSRRSTLYERLPGLSAAVGRSE